MKHIYPFILLVLFPFALSAQNWKTVSDKDTVYFEAGKHNSGTGYDSGIVKAIWVVSSQKVNGDSVFNFFTGIRSTYFYFCIDTLAPSWLGPRFIRSNSGTEYYFNSLGDTITINTQAVTGDSWILAKDNGGLSYKATLANAGTIYIDNVQDSFKTVTIQALNNNNPVASGYNNLTLQFSKAHGWIKALDFNRFPNSINNWEEFGSVIDSGQHLRLPAFFKNLDVKNIDLSWKYMPGNVWIQHYDWTVYTIQGTNQSVTLDSIIDSHFLSPNTISVDFRTDNFTSTWHFQQGPPYSYWYHVDSTSTLYHTETISNSSSLIIKDFVFPEYKFDTMSEGFAANSFCTRYFTDTFCGDKYLLKSHVGVSQIIGHDTCWKILPNVSGYSYDDTTYLPGFGPIYLHHEDGETQTQFSRANYFTYLKLGSCTWGDYVNVLSLGIDDLNKSASYSIYPNPAKDKVCIQTGTLDRRAIISLRDITGRLLLQQPCKGPVSDLSLSGFKPGLYLLSVESPDLRNTFKLLVE